MGFRGIEVHVFETAWSSKGDLGQIAATSEYAATYNRNVLVPWFFFSFTSGPATEQAHFNFFFSEKVSIAKLAILPKLTSSSSSSSSFFNYYYYLL
jgi:hypothetical protein